MTAGRLLHLYPRAWRERYGEEFMAVTGDQPLTVQQVIDIVSGAVDAWLSGEVRRATRVTSASISGGATMTVKTMLCATTRYTTRDALLGAAVLISLTVAFALTGNAAKREGWAVTGELFHNLALFGPIMLSMPFWLTKGQPWKAQAALVGGTLAALTLISYLAARF